MNQTTREEYQAIGLILSSIFIALGSCCLWGIKGLGIVFLIYGAIFLLFAKEVR